MTPIPSSPGSGCSPPRSVEISPPPPHGRWEMRHVGVSSLKDEARGRRITLGSPGGNLVFSWITAVTATEERRGNA